MNFIFAMAQLKSELENEMNQIIPKQKRTFGTASFIVFVVLWGGAVCNMLLA